MKLGPITLSLKNSEPQTAPADLWRGKTSIQNQITRRIVRLAWFSFFLLSTILLSAVSGSASGSQGDLWNVLKTANSFVLLRHAIAPGVGDPDNFELTDCSTQRNLSDTGRSQAAAIGDMFRQHGINKVRVVSSQWCRCLETARLLELGTVEELTYLNSFFQQFERRGHQTEKLSEWITQQNLEHPLVLVTHQVNITSLTDIYPSSGELVIVKRQDSGELLVVGTIRTD